MLLRLVVYLGLAVDAFIKGRYVLGALCCFVPFIGRRGMYLAAFTGIVFYIERYFLEGTLAIGLVLFNLQGNLWMQRREEKRLDAAARRHPPQLE